MIELFLTLGTILTGAGLISFFHTPHFLEDKAKALEKEVVSKFCEICSGNPLNDNLLHEIRVFSREYDYVMRYSEIRSNFSVGVFSLGILLLISGYYYETIFDVFGFHTTIVVLFSALVLPIFKWIYPSIKGIRNILKC
jgi:hypothetical protein